MRSPRRAGIWPRWAPPRWGRPTASTSGTPSGPRSCGSSPRPSPGWAKPSGRWAFPLPEATSASTTRPRERAFFPRRWSEWWECFPDVAKRIPQHFAEPGDRIFLAGPEGTDSLGASAYLKVRHGRTDGRPPKPDLDAEVRLGAFLRAAAAKGSPPPRAISPRGGSLRPWWRVSSLRTARSLARNLRSNCAQRLEGVLFGESPARRSSASDRGTRTLSRRSPPARASLSRRSGWSAAARSGRG